jgi:hypothetical protein
VKRHGQLDRTQIGGQMPAGLGDVLYNEFTQLFAKRLQLVLPKLLYVSRRLDAFQYTQIIELLYV